jgi:hypothetical protein
MKVAVLTLLLITTTSALASAELMGFKKFHLEEDTWSVRYVGNAFMGKLQVQKALLCKTSELAIKEGYSYFAFEDMEADQQLGPVYVVASPGTGAGVQYVGGQSRFHAFEGTVKFAKQPFKEGQKTAEEQRKFWECK